MNSSHRLHALDAARGFALLLGIVLHATMSFFTIIPAQDVSQSTTLAVTFYVIHLFRMSLFFLIAGFFAHLAFHRRGLRAFIKDRAQRIVVPMTAGWLLLAPPTIAAVIWGMSKSFPDGLPQGIDAATSAPQGFPLVHLWFLYYLCLFYALTLAWRVGVVALFDRSGKLCAHVDTLVTFALTHRLAPVLLAAPTFLILQSDAAWPVWFGIHTPDTGFLPQLPALVAFGTAFVFGWLLNRQAALLGVLERQWSFHLAMAIGLTAVCLVIVGPTPSATTPTIVPGGEVMRFLYAGSYALATWHWVFGLIGAALRFCAKESAVRRYVADGSYWMYLAHMPIVFGLQAAMMQVPLHWTLKFPLIVLITLVILLSSYHYLVRPSFIGELLNGRKYPRHRQTTTGTVLADATNPARNDSGPIVVAQLSDVSKRYGTSTALDHVSLAVQPGELLAVLGPNGAGKTTAIGLWLGTHEPDQGIVRLMGASPRDVHSRLGVGVMLQEVHLAPELSAREHIELTASYYRDPLSIDDAIALAGIAPIAHQRYGRLSGGQKRQVQFAAAICGRPQLLFLDEPTVGLDIAARETMWRTIRRLRDQGCAIVLTTHYLEEAETLSDRVVVMAKGRVIAQGSVTEMRALVARKRVSCASVIAVDDIKSWTGVVDAIRENDRVHVTTVDAETLVRRLLATDQGLSHLEVKQASLADAFTELTREAA